MSGDAYHVTAPSPGGDGGFRSMQAALKRAGLQPGRDRLHQRPRHQHAARRRDRARRGQAAVRQCRGQAVDVLDQVGDRPSAGCRRRGRGDLLHPRHPRPDRAADAEPGRSVRRLRRRRPRAAQGQGARGASATLSNSFGFGGTNASVILTAVHLSGCSRCSLARGTLILLAAATSARAGARRSGWRLVVGADLPAARRVRSLQPVIVDLPRGSGVGAIASQLADAGAIEHPLAFALLARATGRDRALKAGEYALDARHVARRDHRAAGERQGRAASGRRAGGADRRTRSRRCSQASRRAVGRAAAAAARGQPAARHLSGPARRAARRGRRAHADRHGRRHSPGPGPRASRTCRCARPRRR